MLIEDTEENHIHRMDLTDEEVQRNSFQKAKNEYQTEDKEVLGLEINTMIKILYNVFCIQGWYHVMRKKKNEGFDALVNISSIVCTVMFWFCIKMLPFHSWFDIFMEGREEVKVIKDIICYFIAIDKFVVIFKFSVTLT